MSPSKALNRVRPILINERKAEMIKTKMNASSLDAIAKANHSTVRKVNSISLNSPSITGVGFEPKIVGAMYKSKENTIVNQVSGNRGVFAFNVTKREDPSKLPNYEAYRQRISEQERNRTVKVFNALKKSVDIEDNRAFYYGIDN